MNADNQEYYISLVHEQRKLPRETETVEFKVNNDDPQIIGEYISAMGNSAAPHEKEFGYIIYGINDITHDIAGTSFDPQKAKVGNEELENWLLTQLTPRINFKFVNVDLPEGHVVVIEVPAANYQPISFKGMEYIRVGSYKKKLKEFPEKERKLWRSFDIRSFETMASKENVDAEKVMELLDTNAFYLLMKLPIPSTRDGIIHDFLEHEFLKPMDNGNYSITNMGALLFARDFNAFNLLKSKAIRIIRYKGNGRTTAIRDYSFERGYAICFHDIINYIMSMLPQEEVIETALREEFITFPEKAVREIIGKMIIHQDLTEKGLYSMVEIFDERIEATNPGKLLINIDRLIDNAPHPRNEKIANFLRLVHICEYRGSGFDRIEEGMKNGKFLLLE